jgi:predicted O-methyltransferase YrrM
MDFIDTELSAYAESHTTAETPLLQELNRETNAKILMPRMLSGHLQGRFLSMLSHMIRPKNILEIGTYTGYSALCFAEGLDREGKLHTIDINDELKPMIQQYISKAGLESKIVFHTGDAAKIIPGLSGPFELVFIDADKINYSKYYELVFDKIPSGGFIIADNVLWSGKVLNAVKADNDTNAIIQFNDKIKNDNRVEHVLLPVRDGLMVIRKK